MRTRQPAKASVLGVPTVRKHPGEVVRLGRWLLSVPIQDANPVCSASRPRSSARPRISRSQSRSDAKHFDPDLADWHRTNGLVIFVLALVQAINGLLRPHLPEKKDPSDAEKQESEEEKSTNRKWWEVGHRLLGIFLLGLCWYQIQLGIKRYNVLYNGGDTESTVLTIFWAVISTFGFIFVVGSLMKILKRNEER